MSKGDQAAISAYTVPELTVTDHGEDGETQLWDEYRKGAEEMRKTVPDFSVTIEESLGIGDWVVTRAVANGTVQHLPSEKGKAKRIQFRFVDVLRFQNGKARQLETYGDNVQLLQQLGLFTPKAPAGQPAAPAGKPSAPAGKPSAPAGSPAAPTP